MNKFKVGDKVRLREDLEVGKEYGRVRFLSGMEDIKGKELTIYYISEDGDYTFDEANYYCSEEMLEKVFNDSDVLKFALDEFNTTKEELIKKHKKNNIDEQDIESIKKRCNDFESYCDNNRFCDTCDVYKFKKRNNIKGLGTRGCMLNCMLVYEYLLKK